MSTVPTVELPYVLTSRARALFQQTPPAAPVVRHTAAPQSHSSRKSFFRNQSQAQACARAPPKGTHEKSGRRTGGEVGRCMSMRARPGSRITGLAEGWLAGCRTRDVGEGLGTEVNLE